MSPRRASTSCRLSVVQAPAEVIRSKPPHPVPAETDEKAPAPLPRSTLILPPPSTASRSPRESDETSLGKVAREVAGAVLTVHQVERSPIVERNESPETLVDPAEPSTVTEEIRPPHRAMPSRVSTRRPRKAPTAG